MLKIGTIVKVTEDNPMGSIMKKDALGIIDTLPQEKDTITYADGKSYDIYWVKTNEEEPRRWYIPERYLEVVGQPMEALKQKPKYKAGDLVRIKGKGTFCTGFVPTQILEIIRHEPSGRAYDRYIVKYHSGFPVRDKDSNFILYDEHIRPANTGKNQYTKKESKEMCKCERGDTVKRYTLEEFEKLGEIKTQISSLEDTAKRYTLEELEKLGLLNTKGLGSALVERIKAVIFEKDTTGGLISRVAEGINELGVPVKSIEDYKKVSSIIDTVEGMLRG